MKRWWNRLRGKTDEASAKKPAPPRQAGIVIADASRDITIPHFTDVLQPVDDTLLARGRGKGLKIYDEVERDTYAWAALQKRKKTLLRREWEVLAGGEAAIDEEAAEFCEEALKKLSFDRISEEFLDATLKGYAVSEIVWRREGAAIVPDRIVSHDQRRFVFDPYWRPRLLTLSNMVKGEALPDRKFIVHRHGVKGNNPYGLGLGTRLFWAVLFKREGVAFWLHFLDKFASPTVVGKSPYGTLESQQRTLLDTLASIVTHSAITVPLGTEVAFLEATRSGAVSYRDWCEYWDKQISICVTGETLTSDIGSVGSRAAAETHQEILEMLVDGDADLLSATLRDQLLTWMVEYNFPGAAVPEVWRLRPENEKSNAETRQAKAEAANAENDAILAIVAAAGRIDGEAEARAYITSFGVTEHLPDATIDRLVKARLAFMEGGERGRDIRQLGLDRLADPGKKKELSPIEALFAEAETRPETLDVLVRQAEAHGAPLINARMDEVRAAIAGASTFGEASAALSALGAAWRPDRFAALLGGAMELAAWQGREAVFREMDGDLNADRWADSFAEPDVFNQEFRERVEFLRGKRPAPTRSHLDLVGAAHDRAFTVAGVTDEAMVADFQEAILKAAEKGTTFAEFQRDFDAIAARYGWDYRGDRGWRALVIFDTNLRTAYMAGRLKQMMHPDVVRMRPYWQYRHAETRTPRTPRPHHESWDGLVLMWNDPWWKNHFPPNGFFCTCGVRTLSRRDLARLGKDGPDQAPEPLYEAVIHPVTGQLVEQEQGVGFGWDYMPGESWLAEAA